MDTRACISRLLLLVFLSLVCFALVGFSELVVEVCAHGAGGGVEGRLIRRRCRGRGVEERVRDAVGVAVGLDKVAAFDVLLEGEERDEFG